MNKMLSVWPKKKVIEVFFGEKKKKSRKFIWNLLVGLKDSSQLFSYILSPWQERSLHQPWIFLYVSNENIQ